MLWRVHNPIATTTNPSVAPSKPSATPSERIDSRCSTIIHQATKTTQPNVTRNHAATLPMIEGRSARGVLDAGGGGATSSVWDGVNRMGREVRGRGSATPAACMAKVEDP